MLKIGRRVNNSTTDYSLIITSFLHLRVWLNPFERYHADKRSIHVLPENKFSIPQIH